jgi:hypothetical protein
VSGLEQTLQTMRVNIWDDEEEENSARNCKDDSCQRQKRDGDAAIDGVSP